MYAKIPTADWISYPVCFAPFYFPVWARSWRLGQELASGRAADQRRTGCFISMTRITMGLTLWSLQSQTSQRVEELPPLRLKAWRGGGLFVDYSDPCLAGSRERSVCAKSLRRIYHQDCFRLVTCTIEKSTSVATDSIKFSNAFS